MECYHVCTDAISNNILFRDDEDYMTGINYLAVSKFSVNIDVLAFCLMSNHIHLVVRGDIGIINKYMIAFKRRYSMWISRKYGEYKIMKRAMHMIKLIDSQDYLKQVIAYVLRNPIVAGVNVSPFQYKWSSALCYFSSDDNVSSGPASRPVMSGNKMMRILKSRYKVPSEVKFSEGNAVDIKSFVNVPYVESIYRTSKAFIYYVGKDNDASIELDMGLSSRITFNDNEVLKAIKKLCMERYSASDLALLSVKERCALVGVLKRNYNSSAKQVARLLNLDVDIVKQMY